MMPAARVLSILLLTSLGISAQPSPTSPSTVSTTRPNLNPQFPIRNGGVLSAPVVLQVGECATAVHVTGFIPHAIVRVFAHVTELIGTANPYFAEADITLTRALKLGESVTATQEVTGLISSQSVDPMIVNGYPAQLSKPIAQAPIFGCGRVVPGNNLNPGTQVTVFRQGLAAPIGKTNATRAFQPVVTSTLASATNVFVRQTSCPGVVGHERHRDSDLLAVMPSPAVVPRPVVETPVVGADAVTIHGLLVGSDVDVSESGGVLGSGLATADRNYVPVHRVSTAPVSATQKLCAPSAPSIPVTPGTTLSTPIILTPVCEGTHYVTVRGAYVNSILVLFRNGSIAGMAGGTLDDVKMTLGAGAVWNLGDQIQVLQYVGTITSPISASVFANCATQNVITQHNDNSRSGSALHEAHLTPSTVASPMFVQLYTRQVDGDIVGQPLFMKSVQFAVGTLKDIFFVTTSKNNVYAFDANDFTSFPATPPVWSRNLCSSARSGVCGETYSGVVGITSTPVIDPGTQTMYLVANCTPAGAAIAGNLNNGRIKIFAINIADGSDRVPSVEIKATDPSSSTQFDPHCQRNRPGLLLSQGVIYAAFATFSCDVGCNTKTGNYHGWVLGYRASDLQQTGVYCTSPNGFGVGIWQTGNGLAADAGGSIYLQTGNAEGDSILDGNRFGNSFLKLSVSPSGALALAHSFTPNNARMAVAAGQQSLDQGDTDIGSGGPMLLPNGRMIGGGKQGRYYVLDQNTMQLTQNSSPDTFGFDGFQAFFNTYHLADAAHPTACMPVPGADGCRVTPTCSIDPRHYGDGELCGPNIHGGPVYWPLDARHGFIYEMAEKDFLKAFRYDTGPQHVTEAPSLTATGSLSRPPTDGMPGGYSSLSANGPTAGIVWTLMPNGDAQWGLRQGRLAAFDALTLRQIWADTEGYAFAKAVPPTIADGKVIRATGTTGSNATADTRVVAVYGLNRALVKRPVTKIQFSIAEKYANYGGALSILGKPVSKETRVGDARGGMFQEFHGSIFGMTSVNTSIMDKHGAEMPTCSVPKGKTTQVASTIYWSPQTYANVVQGEIRTYWLKLGGTKSQLGYPTSDETYTPDHRGRVSTFENGEIWWYPDRGAYLQQRPYDDKGPARGYNR